MCGIAGFVGKGDKEDLLRMVTQLTHRGPDSEGFYIDDDFDVYLGHRRLEVVDIDGGQQPMSTADSKFVITYNGEIYNADLLRHELEGYGYQFITDHSDTEVILNGYRKWGSKIVNKLNGMWAFAILDKEENTVFLSRDRFGQKPLFYTLQNNSFVFSSELDTFQQHHNLSISLSNIGIQKYCAYGYFPGIHTPYKEISKLTPGCNLLFNINEMNFKIKRFWSYSIEPEHGESIIIENKWIEEIQSLIDKSVKRRLVSDVPLGVFLSGGLDSTIISYFASRYLPPGKLKTFSIGFEDHSFDETKMAKQVSNLLGTEHSVKVLRRSIFKNLLTELLEKLDEPLSDSSLISQYLLCKNTKEDVAVALGGDGADEIFAGYDTFKAAKIGKLVENLLPRAIHPAIIKFLGIFPRSHSYMSFRFKIQRLLEGVGHKKALWQPLWLSPVSHMDIRELFSKPIDLEDIFSEAIEEWDSCIQKDDIDKSLQFYGNIFLQNQILTKVDRTSMMHGLEVRTPFLDIDLINCVRRIPSYYKLRKGHTKYILKKAAEAFIPKNIVWRKKIGFSAPLGRWFFEDLISVDTRGIWGDNASNTINNKIHLHLANREDNRLFLWNIYLLTEYFKRNGNNYLDIIR